MSFYGPPFTETYYMCVLCTNEDIDITVTVTIATATATATTAMMTIMMGIFVVTKGSSSSRC